MADAASYVTTTLRIVRAPISSLRTMAWRRGLLDGRRGWLVLAVSLWGLGRVRRAAGRSPELVATERLRPGQSVQITALERDGAHSGSRRGAR